MGIKTLSIIIPAYNVEKYISHCLKNLTTVIDDLDIIVVNDGSTDNTLKLAKDFQKKHKESVKIIDKQNGGHGSTINAAINLAQGKYVRVLDSDDWFNEDTAEKYIEELKNSDEDLILTNYSYNYVAENRKELVNVYEKIGEAKNIAEISNLNVSEHDFISSLSIHSCTIKTDKLKKVWGDGLLEKTFYEDQEFVAKIILATESVKCLNLDVYQYMIGRNEQSMSSEKLFKKRNDHEKVLKILVGMYADCKDDDKKEILSRRIREMFKTHYWIYYYHDGIKNTEKKEFVAFKKKLKAKMPNIDENITWKFKSRLTLGRLKKTMLK